MVANPKSSAREVASAAKALMAAEKQNQEDEHKLVDMRIEDRNHTLDAIAADLGIEIGIVEAAQRKGIGSDLGTSRD